MAAPPKIRRTQEERSTETRRRLLEATVECLFELGYAGTTTTEIADRAGVSRGAQLHHFPRKEELVITAVEYLFARRLSEFRDAFKNLPEGADRGRAAIDLLWSMFKGPTFYAWLEVAVASRSDAPLRSAVRELTHRFMDDVHATFGEFFAPPGSATGDIQAIPEFVFA